MTVALKQIIGFRTGGHGYRSLFDIAASLSYWRQRRATGKAENQWFDNSLAQQRRHLFIKRKKMLLGITYIAPEQLIPAISPQHHAEAIRLSHACAIVSRDCGRVAERLVENRRNLRNSGYDIIRSDIVLLMTGREMSCR